MYKHSSLVSMSPVSTKHYRYFYHHSEKNFCWILTSNVFISSLSINDRGRYCILPSFYTQASRSATWLPSITCTNSIATLGWKCYSCVSIELREWPTIGDKPWGDWPALHCASPISFLSDSGIRGGSRKHVMLGDVHQKRTARHGILGLGW